MNFRAKTVKESIVETVHIIRPSDLNDAGRLFGGLLIIFSSYMGHFKEMLSLLLEELRMSDILLWR